MAQSPIERGPQGTDIVDAEAWEEFCALVAAGSGACDVIRQSTLAPLVSEQSRAYVLGLVEHHRVNSVPFLVEHCGLRGKSVLELGAGTGGLSVAMIQAGVRAVTAVEPNRANYEGGRWRVRAHGLEQQIRLHHAPDASRLPFPDGAFDAAVCSSVLQYVPDDQERRALLREMHRLVREGGRIVVSGSGNALFPGGPHATAWWSGWLPSLAARRRHKRGVSFWELGRVLSPLGAVPLAAPAALSGALRWHRRAMHRLREPDGEARAAARRPTGRELAAHYLLLGGYAIVESVLCPLVGAPVEAFMPYLAAAFEKRRGARPPAPSVKGSSRPAA